MQRATTVITIISVSLLFVAFTAAAESDDVSSSEKSDENIQSINIPEWVWLLNSFWTDKKISNNELINAVNYLQEHDIITLILDKDYDVKTNFLLSLTLIKQANIVDSKFCRVGWYITGYFTPVEEDYQGDFIPIKINEEIRDFRKDFADKVKKEGWGRTLAGDYLGWFDNSYHLSPIALDSNEKSLLVGKIAVDPTVIKNGTKLIIPTLPEPWNELILLASDEGSSIRGNHIDLFVGEGRSAENETFLITGYNNDVCEV